MWRPAAWFRLLVGLIVFANLAACRQIAGITDNPLTDLSTSACGLPYGTTSCASCISENCCTESTTCADDAICDPYESCIGGCKGEPGCRAQCAIDHRAGTTPAVPALSACMAGKCANECGLVCGGVAAYLAPPDAAAACERCTTTVAPCASGAACAASDDCAAAVQQCLRCATLDCSESCSMAHGAQAPRTVTLLGPFDELLTTVRGSCISECQSGGDWSCVGQFGWPDVQSQVVTISFVASAYDSNTPLAGLSVSVCGQDPTCATPLATMSTGSDGTADLMIHAPTSAFLGLNGFLEVTSPAMAYVPTRFYWGFPLSEPRVTLAWPLVPPSENQTLVSGMGYPQDAARGQIIAFVSDCLKNPSPNVQVTTDIQDPEMRVQEFYGISTPTATATDSTGIVYFNNVPVGSAINLTATPMATPRKPSSKVTVEARAGWITGVYMYPTP
jgi:hypothetical protein